MMLQLIRPIFGDLILIGVAVAAWLFILALIWLSWWEKRQVRLMREQARRQFIRPHPPTPLRALFTRFRGRLVLLAVAVGAVAVLVWLNGKSSEAGQNSSYKTPLAAAIARYEGESPLSAPAVARSVVSTIVTDLWNQPVLNARTLNLAVDTNIFKGRDSGYPDHAAHTSGANAVSGEAKTLEANQR